MRASDQWYVATRLTWALRSQWWSAERIRRWQETALVEIMRHAVAHVPHYQRLGIDPGSITTSDDLQRFPLLSKRDIQREPAALLANGFDPQDLFESRTSGSSGEPTTTCFDRPAWLLGKYVLKMRRIAATKGAGIGRRVLIVSEQPADKLAAAIDDGPAGGVFFRQRRVSIHQPADAHIAALREFRPHVIYAYPSWLLDLVTSAEQTAASLPRIEAIHTSSEVLTRGARERIQAALGGRVYDVYGSTEMKEVAWECGHGCYHANFESTFIERPAGEARGQLVLTSLVNRAMPLIRFATGDQAVFGDEACPCGRQSPCLSGIDGRVGDVITLPSGRRLSPYVLTTAIEADSSVLQFRIVQTAPSSIRIEIVRKSGTAPEKPADELCAELARLATEPLEFTAHDVEGFERPANGKRSVFTRSVAAA